MCQRVRLSRGKRSRVHKMKAPVPDPEDATYNTRMCAFHQLGKCLKGNLCTFAHSYAALRQGQPCEVGVAVEQTSAADPTEAKEEHVPLFGRRFFLPPPPPSYFVHTPYTCGEKCKGVCSCLMC